MAPLAPATPTAPAAAGQPVTPIVQEMIAGAPTPAAPAVVQTLPAQAATPDTTPEAAAAPALEGAPAPTVTSGDGPITVDLPGGIQPPEQGFFEGAGQQIGAAWQLDTTVGAAAAVLNVDSDDPSTTINRLSDTELWNSLTDDEKATPEFFADVLTDRDLAERRAALRRKEELEDQLGAGPLPAILASIVAQFGDPINYIPLAGAGSKAVTGARTGLAAFGRSAALVGGSSIALTAAQETFIHQVQAGRTLGDSLTAMAMSGLIGSGLGGPLGVLARRGAIRRAEIDAFDAGEGGPLLLEGPRSPDTPPSSPQERFRAEAEAIQTEATRRKDAVEAGRLAGQEALARGASVEEAEAIVRRETARAYQGTAETVPPAAASEAPPPGRVIDDLTAEPLAPDAYDEAVAAGRELPEAERIALAQRADEGGFFTPEELGRMEGAKQTFDGELAGVRAKIAEVEASIENLTSLREAATERGPRQSFSQRLRRKREELEELAARELDLSEIRRALDDAANGGLPLVRGAAREMADTINRTVEEPRPTPNSSQIAADLAYLEDLVAASERRLEGKTETLGTGPRRPPPRNLGEVEAQAMDVNQPAELEMQGTSRSLSAGAAPRFVGSTDLKFNPDDTRLAARNVLSRMALAVYKRGQGQFKTVGNALTAVPRLSNLGLANPGVQLLGSRFAAARDYAMRMAMTNLDQVGPNAGRAFQDHVPVEALVRQRAGSAIIRQRAIFQAGYRSYLRDVKAFNKQAKAAGQPTRPVRSPDEFSREVARALRRADIDPNNPGRNKHVSMVAKQYHDEFMRPFLDELTNAGLLENMPPDASLGYLHRVYDKRRIRQHIDTFRTIIGNHIRRMPEAQSYSDEQLKKIVSDTVDNILSPTTDIGFPQYRVVAARGPLATRELQIDDRLLDHAAVTVNGKQEFTSFLIDDVNILMEKYIKTAVADLAMTKEFGSPNPLAAMQDALGNEAQTNVAAMLRGGEITQRQAEIMLKEAEAEKFALQTVYERVRGTSTIPVNPTYDVPRRILHQLRNWSTMRLLGLSTASSLPDTGRIIMQQGMMRTYGTLFREMQTAFAGTRANVKTLRALNIGTDLQLAVTAQRLTDAGTNLASRTMIERAGDRGAELMYLLNGQNHWNTGLKTMSGHMGFQDILEAADLVSKGAAVPEAMKVRLARMNISEDDLAEIANQRDPERWRVGRGQPDPEFGWFQTEDGTYVSALDSWPNRVLAERIGANLLALTDSTVITPGALDSPGWFDTEAGKVFGHIKRFLFAAAGRTTLVGLQRQDADALLGLLHMVALGGASLYLRYALAGRLSEIETMDTNEFVLNAIDRSGAIPLFFEIDNATGALIGNYAQPSRLLTGAAPQRTSFNAAAKYLLGTSGGGLLDARQTAEYLAQKDWEADAADWRRMYRLLPFQNLVGFSALMEHLVLPPR